MEDDLKKKFDEDVRIVKDDEGEELNRHLKEKYLDTRIKYGEDKTFEEEHFPGPSSRGPFLQLNLENLKDYKILELTNNDKVKKFYSDNISGYSPDEIKYLQDNRAVIQHALLYWVSRDAKITTYNEYLFRKLSEAFKYSPQIDIGKGYHHLVIIFFKKNGKYYVALNLCPPGSLNDKNFFKSSNINIQTFHHFYYHIMDFNYRENANKVLPNLPYSANTNMVGYNLTANTDIFLPNNAKTYEEAIEYANEMEAKVDAPDNLTQEQLGGKKTSKKEVLGKMRCIYKIPGDRKEYVKHKGKLITVKDYKMLNKKPKKVADKKPKRSKK